MNIFLIRHGAAEEKTLFGKDSERKLTSKGKTDLKRSIDIYKPLLVNIETVISSPYKRAFQTAEIVQEELKLKKDILIDNRLSPGSRIENILELCNEIDTDNVALIGHEPDISQHVSDLSSNSGIKINIRKGSIVKISFISKPRLSEGILEFLLPPI
jgi:phosphohistidine phosphatase